MERIFWVECPHCRGRFYCNYAELRHAGVRLACPFCQASFLPEEAAALDDRPEPQESGASPAPRE